MLKVFSVDYLQHGLSNGARYRVSAEGIEVYALGKALGDIWCRDDCGQGCAVANTFCHGNDIRNNTLCLKSPVVGACAPKSCLNFVCYAYSTCFADVLVCVGKEAIGVDDCSANALYRLGKETSNTARRGVLDKALDVGSVFGAGFGVITPPGSTKGIGCNRVVNPKAVRVVVFPGAVGCESHCRSTATMVGIA